METITSQTTLIGRDELARRLGVSKWTLWAWASKGILPRPIRLGPTRMHRWREIDIKIWLDRCKSERGKITARVPLPPEKPKVERRRLSATFHEGRAA